MLKNTYKEEKDLSFLEDFDDEYIDLKLIFSTMNS